RTLLLYPGSLVVGEVLRNGKLLTSKAQGAWVGDHDRPDHMLGVGGAQPTSNAGANVATMSSVTRVAESGHQLGKCRTRAAEVPAALPDRGGESEARQRWDHKIERVPRIGTVGTRITQRADQ